jgi:hypothetical protein
MKTILAAIIALVAIAGPTVLVLVLAWRRKPNHPLPWRRASEDLDNPDPNQSSRRWQGCLSGFGDGGQGAGES